MISRVATLQRFDLRKVINQAQFMLVPVVPNPGGGEQTFRTHRSPVPSARSLDAAELSRLDSSLSCPALLDDAVSRQSSRLHHELVADNPIDQATAVRSHFCCG